MPHYYRQSQCGSKSWGQITFSLAARKLPKPYTASLFRQSPCMVSSLLSARCLSSLIASGLSQLVEAAWELLSSSKRFLHMMDNTLYLFNVSSAHNVEVNATIAQIAEAPQRFFQVRSIIPSKPTVRALT